jgi:diguanylate cyclase (GGDEF)-like protein
MPNNAGQLRKKARPKPILSIRARLIVVALVAVAPMMFERMHDLERTRVERVEFARTQAADLARTGAEGQREVVYSTRAVLELVAQLFSQTPPDGADCIRILAALTRNIPWMRGIGIAGTDGRIACSTEARANGLNISDRAYFQEALHAHEFALSDYLIARVLHVPSLIATFPIIGRDGKVGGVVVAAIDLNWIGELAAATARRAGASVVLLDGHGTVIAGAAEQRALIGKNFAGTTLADGMMANEQGTVMTVGFDGVRRIFAYVRVPWTRASLAIGFGEAMVYSGIDHEIRMAYLQLALFGILVLLAAWLGGERLILRPIRSLVRIASRLGRGDLQVRATAEVWATEFQPLAAAFDDMAHKLAVREEELHIANQHLEELASLDALTGMANRRGFGRELERQWQHATELHQPLALMMADIDYFKRFNDRYGHVRGDECLRAVAATLSLAAVDHAVVVARYGGEEFAVLLPGLDRARVTVLAEELRRAVEHLGIEHDQAPSGTVTVSIGVESVIPEPNQPAADLVEAADRTLYEAKRRGRNAVAAHVPVPLNAAS